MKRIIIILALVVLAFSGCRKEADYFPYIGETSDLAYDSYSSQFEYIWKCISSGYVFWDVDETDWDAVYDEYIPKFQALDAKHNAGQDVTLAELEALYVGAMGGLKDHHLLIKMKNLFPSPNDVDQFLNIRPGSIEAEKRDYYIESIDDEYEHLIEFLDNLDTQYNLEVHETAIGVDEGEEVLYHYCLFILPDGRKIPYLWQSLAAITPIMESLGGSDVSSAAAAVIDHWLTAIKETPREQLAGIILDNRCNTGGYQDDLDYLVGSFINQKTEFCKSRYKEGPGRLEYSAWTPNYLEPQSRYHRDLTAENIPYVVICDLYSISMGEAEAEVIKALLPTSYIVGERTFGATGALQSESYIDLSYGGPFGDYDNGPHYIYTATFECATNGKVLEGIGITPDLEVLRKNHNGDFKPQLDAAINYIQNRH